MTRDNADKGGVSFICPGRNEGNHIYETLRDLHSAMSAQDYDFELIVINDGSEDATPAEMRRFAESHDHTRLIDRAENRGLGYSIREGYASATMPYVMFVPTNGMLDAHSVFHQFEARAPDVMIAFQIENLEQRPLHRRLVSRAYQLLMTTYFGLSPNLYVHAMVLYPRAALDLDKLKADHSFHLVETLVFANRVWGLKLVTRMNRMANTNGLQKTKSFRLKNLQDMAKNALELKARLR